MPFGLARPTLEDGGVRSTDQLESFKKGQSRFEPLPPPTRTPFRLGLGDVIGEAAEQAIRQSGAIRFHAVGDTGGVKDPHPQQNVADCMELDFNEARRPHFFYHLGDVVYFNGEEREYYSQFYSPYAHYPGPIFAIPGNHDGAPARGDQSLSAFVRHFCSSQSSDTDEADDSERKTMIQPNVFWTLEAPFVSVVGLYTNVPSGGEVRDDQRDWMIEEFSTLPSDKALIVALHHPLFSLDNSHSGSQPMVELMTTAIEASGRVPDAILTGHVHNYQRLTWHVRGNDVPVVVAGAGGYHNLHRMLPGPDGDAIVTPFRLNKQDAVLEKYSDRRYGYAMVEVSEELLAIKYFTVDHTAEDPARRLFDAVVKRR